MTTLYTVETREGEFLFQAPLDMLGRILNLHPEGVSRVQRECDMRLVCELRASRPFNIGIVEVHVWTTPPWRRLL
jgi:hypothetical protein